MTLYYEDDPADQTTVPQLPPLLRAVEVPAGLGRAGQGRCGCRKYRSWHCFLR